MNTPPNETPDRDAARAAADAHERAAEDTLETAAEGGGADTRSGLASPTDDAPPDAEERADSPPRPREIGGQAGPEPTRYGDWEKKGRCTDF